MTAKFNATIFALAILTIASTGFSAKAKADTFDFSFTDSRGNVAGSVTGEIFGLVNNTTGPATEILITGYPAGLDSVFGPGPINATAWTNQIANSFTEKNGEITSLVFRATDTVHGVPMNAQLYLAGDLGLLSLRNGLYAYGDNLDPPPATPEPAYLVLTGLGLGGLVFLKFRRNAARG